MNVFKVRWRGPYGRGFLFGEYLSYKEAEAAAQAWMAVMADEPDIRYSTQVFEVSDRN